MQNNRAKFKIFLVLTCCFTLYALSFKFVSAYTLLQALPGGVTEVSKLSDYLSWLFKFTLAAAAFLAILQIVIGGLQIIYGGASEIARSNAKKRIRDALWGLLLAFGAVLILETISPGQFTNLNLAITPVTIEAPAPTPAMEGEWVTKLADDSRTRDYLKSKYIFTNKGPCPNSYYDTNCTMLSDLPQNAVDGVIKIKQDSGAAITITGGTEIGIHKEHGPNKPVLDLNFNNDLLFYMHDKVGLPSGQKMELNTRYTSTDGKFTVIRENNASGRGQHFHVVFQ